MPFITGRGGPPSNQGWGNQGWGNQQGGYDYNYYGQPGGYDYNSYYGGYGNGYGNGYDYNSYYNQWGQGYGQGYGSYDQCKRFIWFMVSVCILLFEIMLNKGLESLSFLS